MNESGKIGGRCFCGQVRFTVEPPAKYACFCHCESCQQAAGAPVVAWATFARDSLDVTQGAITWFESSPGVTRGHCALCGTCISYEHVKRDGQIDITLNALDDPGSIEPLSHIWVEDKQPWFTINDGLPQYPQTVTSD